MIQSMWAIFNIDAYGQDASVILGEGYSGTVWSSYAEEPHLSNDGQMFIVGIDAKLSTLNKFALDPLCSGVYCYYEIQTIISGWNNA